MSDFEKKNLNCNDYNSLTQDWVNQLCQLGYKRAFEWDSDSNTYVDGWRSEAGGPVQTTYEAWSDATSTPDDLKLGIEKEPPAPTYRKPF
jgi:hypothetical protein